MMEYCSRFLHNCFISPTTHLGCWVMKAQKETKTMSSRIAAVNPAETQGKTRELLGAVEKMLGATPNLFRVAAQAPSVLESMVGLFGATSKGTLDARTREAIALAVAEANGCDYCLSAHTVLGKGAGLSEAEI